jgi:hypothetical protein
MAPATRRKKMHASLGYLTKEQLTGALDLYQNELSESSLRTAIR